MHKNHRKFQERTVRTGLVVGAVCRRTRRSAWVRRLGRSADRGMTTSGIAALLVSHMVRVPLAGCYVCLRCHTALTPCVAFGEGEVVKVTLAGGPPVVPDDMDHSEERIDRTCPCVRRPTSLITVGDL